MSQMPLVSIIIPTYNSGQWVCEAVDSALGQTYPAIEVIVVDDGSTDNTGSLLEREYGDSIRYIYQTNRGPAGARNTGLRIGRGEYVQFLDADDILLPEKVALSVRYLEENPDHNIAYSDFEYFLDGQPGKREPSPAWFKAKYTSGDILESLLIENFIVCHAILARRADIIAAGMFDESLKACEDYDLWLRMANGGCKFVFIDEVLVLYRKRPSSLSEQGISNIKSTILVLEKFREFATFRTHNEKQLYRRHISDLHEQVASLHMEQGDRLQALKHYLRASAYVPSKARHFVKRVFFRHLRDLGAHN